MKMQIKWFHEHKQNVWKDPGDSRHRNARVLGINRSTTELDHLQKKVSAGAEGVNFLAPSGSGSLCHTQRMGVGGGIFLLSLYLTFSSPSLTLSHVMTVKSPRRIVPPSLWPLFTLSNYQLKSMLQFWFFSFTSLPRSNPSKQEVIENPVKESKRLL